MKHPRGSTERSSSDADLAVVAGAAARPAAAPELLSPEALVARWHDAVGLRTLKKWRGLKRGPAFLRIGNRVLYRVADVEAFEAARVEGATRAEDPELVRRGIVLHEGRGGRLTLEPPPG